MKQATRSTGRVVVFAGAAALLTLMLIGHTWIPDTDGLGVAIDTAAPWLGALIPILAVVAVLCRCPAGAVAALAPLLAWTYLFGSWWAPVPGTHPVSTSASVRIVSQNLFAANTTPLATARALAAIDADIIAVQELGGTNREPALRILDDIYPYRTESGTVGLWSRYPISDTTPVDVGVDWHRGLRTHITTPAGDLVVYVVHLPSIRPGDTATRNRGLALLSRELTADRAEHIVVAGDFNTASTDRHWTAFAPGYRDIHSGAAFTWPAAFPLARLDHILVRGLKITGTSVSRLPGPDHRAISAEIGGVES
ncbi:endonuclease/exonuclease/phosphatase family protein [Nocardia sp. NBC_01503]|uniref:endonuclease/exonuclease/phosphatase family protein n=1 Tax=Nocardia sp. NBC_01503 TaxID=2975997 RepID=UPI002E7BA752|nr:endonuclease/exonuclease/phosphatase family protein [Nocardia sp. NBC_01503]WTL31970.1 endonuclease/exonuclease/phosphatase family protein [Nocardia sp. NBC_01503]